MIKYPRLREEEHAQARKWNAYKTERGAYQEARGTAEPGVKSLEAEIMDWADDITYAVHDLEDFVRAGRIPIARLLDLPAELRDFRDAAARQIKKKNEKFDPVDAGADLVNALTLAFSGATDYRGTSRDQADLQQGCRVLINQYASAVEVHGDAPFLRVSGKIKNEIEMLKQLPWHYVIHHPGLATLQEGHTRVIEELFDLLLLWVTKAERRDELFRLPIRLQDLYNVTLVEEGRDEYQDDLARRGRAVADYVASLTEDQALDLHARLMGASGASVLDPWVAY